MESSIGSRIMELRKSLKLTQQDFADKIGCSRTAVAGYESGSRTPLDPIITAICREFNVSETWLREGTGSMLVPLTPDQKLAHAFGRMVSGRDDGAENRKVFIEMIMELSPQQLEAVKGIILELAGKLHD